MAFKINDSIAYTGKIDWELRKFHGSQLSTHRGSSYNSFLIRDEKTVLIDSVWTPHTAEFIRELKKIIDLNEIDYVVSTHAEPDHSGALPHLMAAIPDTPIYCTKNGVKSLQGYYHKDWNFQPVKTGETLNLGSKELIFVEAPMLHWPDTMMAFLTGDNILFSSDVFGQHIASEYMYNDLENEFEVYSEAMNYYANIVAPFSKKALSKIDEFDKMNLPLEMIFPAHGILWRNNPREIVDKYLEWANGYKENQVTIVYETMYNSTRKLAEAIAAGIKDSDSDVKIKLFNAAKTDTSDLVTEVFRSKAMLAGSPNLNGGILNNMAALLEELAGMSLTGKKAGAFGSYGWSPANIKHLNSGLENAGFELTGKGVKTTWAPDEKALGLAYDFGKEFAEAVK